MRSRSARWIRVASVTVFFGIAASVWAFQVIEAPKQANFLPVDIPERTTSEMPAQDREGRSSSAFPVTIRKPAGPPRVATGMFDPHGNEVTAACSTCHATRPPDVTNKTVADLKEFHGDLKFSHGSVSCLSCHNSTDYNALKLADGSRVEFVDVMTLCAQCHGPQMIDYKHGAHGGMNGFWDLMRGPREKNNCVDCHHPHSPQFPKMHPTFKPKDRFLHQQGATHGVP